jgi:hypothetical protein
LPSPLAIASQEVALSSNHEEEERRPIVPTVIEPVFSNHLALNVNFENMLSYMNGTIGQQNPFFISFVFPNQFL